MKKNMAEQMFEKLNFYKTEYANIEGYQKDTNSGFIRIVFDKNYYTLKITCDWFNSQYDQSIEEMEEDE